MRWFIVLLIVANVVLFFWVQQQSRPLPGTASLPPPDVGRLRLMSELDEEKADTGIEKSALVVAETVSHRVQEAVTIPPVSSVIVEPAAKVPAVESVGPPTVVDTEAVVADAALPEVDPAPADPSIPSMPVQPEMEQMETGPAASVPVASEAAATEDAIAETVDRSDAQVPEEPAVPAVQEARTGPTEAGAGDDPQPAVIAGLAETQPQAAGAPEARVAGQPETTPGPQVAEGDSAVCYRVGPFNPEDADRLISELPASMELLSDLTEEYSSIDRYYVMIPPLPSRAAGRQKLKELAEAGVTDTWLFPSGEYRNAISLGFFSREGGAKRHAANIAKKGFPAEVREKSSTRERRWLFFNDNDGTPGFSLPLPEGVAVEEKACP